MSAGSSGGSGASRTWRALRVLLALVVLLALGLVAIRAAVASAARGRTFAVDEAPARNVGIVFGAAVGSLVLRDRVATGVALYQAHKVNHLLLSGDNRRSSYDEPRAMKKLALEAGVPESAIVLDYAGRRTYDSCARARDIFRLDDAILVTQEFHLARALYLCEHLGLRAVGVPADRQTYRHPSWLWVREVLASAKAFVDVNVRRPHVLGGPRLPISDGPAPQAPQTPQSPVAPQANPPSPGEAPGGEPAGPGDPDDDVSR